MKTFLSIVFLTVAVSLFSQNTKIDSLQQRLNHTKGTERILVLNDLAYAYGYVDFNKSITLAKEALKLAKIQKYNKAKALTYDILGRAYFISGNYKVAEQYYNKCIDTAKKYGTKDDIYKALRHKTILIYTTIGVPEFSNDSIESLQTIKQYINLTIEKKNYLDFREGLQFFVFYTQRFNESLTNTYFEELLNRTKNDNEFLASIYSNKGLFYDLKFKYYYAIEANQNTLKLTKNLNLKTNSLLRIGIIYFELRKYKEAAKYYSDAMQVIENNEFENREPLKDIVEINLAQSYLKLKQNYKTVISHFTNALNSPYLIKRNNAIICTGLGEAYLAVDSLDKAVLFINNSIEIYESLNLKNEKLGALGAKAELLTRKKQWNQLSEVVSEITILANDVQEYYMLYDCYKFLSNYYEKLGDYKKANEYIKKWTIANDSINSRELTNRISELEFKYDTEKKEQQIVLQQDIIKNKNQLLVFVIIAGSLIFAALLVIFILYRIRNKAYKQLVYQSIKNTSNAQLLKIEDDIEDEDTIETKNGNSQLDENLKKQIEISLNKQLAAKVYLEPNLILKTLAEKCDTNRSYLSQFINERYSMNFNTFINTLRINEAKHIISNKDNNIPLKELYLRLGFNTYSVFNEAFKKHVGVTPNFYQKTIKDLFDTSNSN